MSERQYSHAEIVLGDHIGDLIERVNDTLDLKLTDDEWEAMHDRIFAAIMDRETQP